MLAAILTLALARGAPAPWGNVPNLAELECAIHGFAVEFGSANVPAAAGALHDALNLGSCPGLPSREEVIDRAEKMTVQGFQLPHAGPFATTVYVATTGSDAAAGTQAAPFATLERARAAVSPAAKPALVIIAAGKYFINSTLQLGPKDSEVSYTAATGAKVVLSGGIHLGGLDWKPSAANPSILVADVKNVPGLVSSAEQRFWAAEAAQGLVATPVPRAGQDAATETATAPTGWVSFPGHCMNDRCSVGHCHCASGPAQLHCDHCATTGDSCTAEIVAACAARPDCHSFAQNGQAYQLYSLNNWSAAPNAAWNSFARAGPQAIAPPPPGPANNCGGRPHPGPHPGPHPPAPPHKWGTPPALWNTLHVDGVRQVRARFPNGNPQDNSGKCFSKVQHPGTEGCDWLSAQSGVGSTPKSSSVYDYRSPLDRNNAPASPVAGGGGSYGTFKYTIYEPPAGHPVYNKPMPDWTWTNNSLFSFWADPLSRPGGVAYGGDLNKTYGNAGTGVVQMFHGGLWGGWTYQVSQQDTRGNALLFSHGGYQEARGSGIGHNHYVVTNVKEELDVPGEWFHDPVTAELLFWPNSTDGKVGTEIVAPVLAALVRIEGANNVSFSGITFTETRATFLEQYEVPSGGDWSVHRGAAFEVVDSSSVHVTGCTFDQVGGNGVLFSNAVIDSQVTNSEFVQCGDSAVVSVGQSVGIDGTAPTFPKDNLIANNHMHEVGVYGKQTSCYFQALGQRNTLKDNLCYNGPRAGINWNDGFAGGSTVSGNLVFNMVRETGDHGPYNSWDRQPYLTHSGVLDGYTPSDKMGLNASILKKADFQTKNFMINGYNGVWTFDHDDGSQYFNDTGNFMVFGGCKNYMGNHKSCDNNVIVHPGIAERATGGRRCQTDDNKVFQNQYHDNNHCVTHDGVFYSMSIAKCDKADIDPHVFQTWNNTFYSPTATFTEGPCGSLSAWQAAGQDRGSKVLPMPSVDAIVAMGKAVLA